MMRCKVELRYPASSLLSPDDDADDDVVVVR